MSLRTWWKKQWAKNLVFFGIMSLFFFTDLPQWITVQYMRLTLPTPETITPQPTSSNSVYGYDIVLTDINGERVKLHNFKGKHVFLSLWASWCVPCIAEFSSLEELEGLIPELSLVVANIEDQRAFDKYVQKSDHDLPFYRISSPMPADLSAPSIPASYILNEEGQVIYRHFGAVDWSDPSVVSKLKALIK